MIDSYKWMKYHIFTIWLVNFDVMLMRLEGCLKAYPVALTFKNAGSIVKNIFII